MNTLLNICLAILLSRRARTILWLHVRRHPVIPAITGVALLIVAVTYSLSGSDDVTSYVGIGEQHRIVDVPRAEVIVPPPPQDDGSPSDIFTVIISVLTGPAGKALFLICLVGVAGFMLMTGQSFEAILLVLFGGTLVMGANFIVGFVL